MKSNTKDLTLIVIVLLMAVVAACTTSCTANERARNLGGTETITLKPGERLVNITWKQDDNLWVLTKQDSTKPSTYTFQEKSSYGVIEGKVIINEQ